jgi:quercetin dioxygenase-like cupin family protein
MAARRTPGDAVGLARDDLEKRLANEGLTPRSWSNAPGYRYSPHEHDYHKVLYCASGSITFHTDEGDLALAAGDRLDVEPHTRHAATVGRDGVECVEAAAHR